MRSLRFIYVGFAVLMAVACSEDVRNEPVADGDIQLGAAVENLQINSRAVANPFHGGQPFTAAVWFRHHDGVYEDNPDATTSLPVHTNVEFDASLQAYVWYNNKNLKYPAADTEVKCIGLYPATDWNTSDNINISHDIDGEADLMFAKEITGKWTEKFPVQEYGHLLTWIKINVCASSHDAVASWGSIQQIEISSDSKVTVVNLQTGQCQYSGEQMIETISAGGGVSLGTTAREVGSVFCSPEKEYTVKVTAINQIGETVEKTITLKLNLMDANGEITALENERDAIGKCFVFSLNFMPYDVIEGMCALNAWNSQDESIYIQ